jgi:pimeloyl-ACP methyl ester carboxylesterase
MTGQHPAPDGSGDRGKGALYVPEFEHDGWRLAYGDHGDGPAVILIHGVLFDGTQFEPQVQALSDRYRVITPDLRAHGGSEHRQTEYDQWDLMEDHVALLDHLGVERAVWGGVSQGGFQSQRAALKHPDRVAGLILVDSQAGPEDENRGPMFEASAQIAAEHGWNEELLALATTFLFADGAGQDLRQHWIDRWMRQETFDAVELMHVVTRREDLLDRMGEITAPALVVHGEEDISIEMEKAEAMAEALGGEVEFVRVPGAGHSSTIEKPDVVNAAIESFLERVWPA